MKKNIIPFKKYRCLIVGIIFVFICILVFALAAANTREEKSFRVFHPTDKRMVEPSRPIIIYGDSHNIEQVHKKILYKVAEINPRAVFHTGDLTLEGEPAHYQILFKNLELIDGIPFYPVLGNHDVNTQLFFDYFKLPHNEEWYVVEHDDLFTIFLNGNKAIHQQSEQYKWLEEQLENASKTDKFKIIIIHQNSYSSGIHDGDGIRLQKIVVPLFEKFNVDIVFNGHEHTYERSFVNDVYYVSTGGGGGIIRKKQDEWEYSQVYLPVNHYCKIWTEGDKLFLEAIDLSNNVIDELEIKKDQI